MDFPVNYNFYCTYLIRIFKILRLIFAFSGFLSKHVHLHEILCVTVTCSKWFNMAVLAIHTVSFTVKEHGGYCEQKNITEPSLPSSSLMLSLL